ncbi:MAG: radical SAM protein [Thermofilaceae archaeon]|nr:radical SAM protein [Thermofilaceae archaeon]MCX8181156.1 radical SAM protein [Thermofilaceae archaeon]MDW8004779.1 radical SAM protein [Thermofilaceae archaeon]
MEDYLKSSDPVRRLFTVQDSLPLIGHIAFGIIDRGTNLLQIRPTTLCPLSCIFCSVDAGPATRNRITEYVVDLNYLLTWFKWTVKEKGLKCVHAYIDAVGDPLTYKYIVELVRRLRELSFVETIAMETHGALLTEKVAEELDDAGLDRLNLSLDALDSIKAKMLSGSLWFEVNRVVKVAEYITSSLNMDLLVAPVWVPGINDEEIPKIIEWALRIGAGKRWPPLGIQKFELHKYGRKPKGVREMKWQEFYAILRKLEDRYGVKLILRPEDFNIKRTKPLPLTLRRFEKVKVRVVGPGWLKGQWLGVAKNRVVTLVGSRSEPPIGRKVSATVLSAKHNIYVARVT